MMNKMRPLLLLSFAMLGCSANAELFERSEEFGTDSPWQDCFAAAVDGQSGDPCLAETGESLPGDAWACAAVDEASGCAVEARCRDQRLDHVSRRCVDPELEIGEPWSPAWDDCETAAIAGVDGDECVADGVAFACEIAVGEACVSVSCDAGTLSVDRSAPLATCPDLDPGAG